jgi:plastocyanin
VNFSIDGGHNLKWDDLGTIHTISHSRTFNDAGTFTFHCTFHGGMTGVIIVE